MLARRSAGPGWAVASIGALLVLFAGLALSAARTKSPTFDEPLMLVGAFVHRYYRDFRLDAEDPPLWQYWATLPTGRDALRLPQGGFWRDLPADYEAQWPFAHEVLYRTGGNDPDPLFARARAMMTALGVLLGMAVAWLAWRLGGPGAAVLAVALLALDPNFLAHAPLLKNDVGITLCLVAIVAACWSVGRRATAANVILLGLFSGAGLAVKYTGVLAAPLVLGLLGLRALLPPPWPIMGWTARTRMARLAGTAAIAVAVAAVAYGSVWATYGFRYRAVPDEALALDFPRLAAEVALYREKAEEGSRAIGIEEAKALPRDGLTRAVLWLRDHRLLPEAWLAGLLYTHGRGQARGTFILGRSANRGLWYYFPFAILVKTPSATLVLLVAAAAGAVALAVRRRPWGFDGTWAAIALVVPVAMYLGVAVVSRLNLGLRHVLPVYPFLFVAVGVVAVGLLRARWQWGVVATLVVLVGVESVAAWPDFLPFFNAPAGGRRGGLALLGDSNLDWGQDLPLLAAWQRRHPDVPLWLAYFGVADPAYYGIRYQNLDPDAGGYYFGPAGRRFDPDHGDSGVLAVSATHLQGVYLGTELYSPLRARQPLEVLGGSIYLYGPFGRPR